MLALAIPLQKRFVAKSLVIFRQSSKTTDERLKYENELLGAMQVVKFYAWENSFENRIGNVRTKELDLLWRAKRLQMINSFFINSVPIFVTVVTFAVYALFIETRRNRSCLEETGLSGPEPSCHRRKNRNSRITS